MTSSRLLVVPLVLAALAPTAPAGLFSRKPKSNPADRVPELLIQLKGDTDESLRTAAAEELRQYDPKSFPEIANGLIDSLARDASPAVRAEAASSLGKMRPISQQAGYALEQAQNNDASVRVRLAARQALWQYHLVGYRGGKAPDAPANAEPAPTPKPVVQPAARGGSGRRESPEPPLAVPGPGATVSRPRSTVPAQLIPTNPGLQPLPQAPEPARPVTPTPADGPALPPRG
jgi:hypothetical protein